jgi:hypothetical protein
MIAKVDAGQMRGSLSGVDDFHVSDRRRTSLLQTTPVVVPYDGQIRYASSGSDRDGLFVRDRRPLR